MGATRDPGLLKRTLDFIKTKARDQDIIYYFRGLSFFNLKMRKALVDYFKDQYEVVRKPISTIDFRQYDD